MPMYGAFMDRDEMNDRLKAIGVSQARMCRALGLGRSAPTNWHEKVPDYVQAYVIALEELDEVGRLEAIHKSCIAQMKST